ncbi:MAG: hypothetical protein K9J12_12860 [Melioribacteraceae bacterium]|nr:hypothetical protein [Melioribacteraceae bacterium]MCF8264082.1 hypothetical protein [Melioribacteraceae bacterium]MCF8413296.1 hypothetical protein [Melioribacteraceae bacterium]MCF8430851.1 hypothetical protein [Melioribacteraceae bacterium]
MLKSKFVVSFAVLFTLMLSTANINLAQGSKNLSKEKYEQAVANIKNAIVSDNSGLRSSAIYMTGKYQLSELGDALINEYRKEESKSTRFLIAFSIYQLGDKNLIDELITESFLKGDVELEETVQSMLKVYEITQI